MPEAMLRGIPVLASNLGGLPEAKLGVDYLLPVNPITGYKPTVDEHMVPVAEVPPQDVSPWQAALERLVTDREHYNQLARESRSAALDYAENLSVLPFEAYLEALIQKPQRDRGPKPPAPLSDDKRKLLALRMKQAAARKANPWFPNIEHSQKFRLFCFPFAGGGTLSYRSWTEALKPLAVVCPASLPGREARLNEPAIDRMETLLDALEREIEPYLGTPFAFYGHSMGAIIAFELVRRLSKNGRPLPLALFVSGARAPQFRLGHQPPPEPSDTELLEQLRKLDGMPREILENPALLAVAIPALRADTRLYRNYVYYPGSPLPVRLRLRRLGRPQRAAFPYRGLEAADHRSIHVPRIRRRTLLHPISPKGIFKIAEIGYCSAVFARILIHRVVQIQNGCPLVPGFRFPPAWSRRPEKQIPDFAVRAATKNTTSRPSITETVPITM